MVVHIVLIEIVYILASKKLSVLGSLSTSIVNV